MFVVVSCIWFVFYSVKIEDSVVRDDWYMDGKTLYADVSKDKLAYDKGITGVMTILDHDIEFKLNTPTGSQFKAPNALKVEISHATQNVKDRDFVVNRGADGTYHGTVSLDPSQGKYYIIIHDPANTWRLRTVQHLPTTEPLNFKPLNAFKPQTKSG